MEKLPPAEENIEKVEIEIESRDKLVAILTNMIMQGIPEEIEGKLEVKTYDSNFPLFKGINEPAYGYLTRGVVQLNIRLLSQPVKTEFEEGD